MYRLLIVFFCFNIASGALLRTLCRANVTSAGLNLRPSYKPPHNSYRCGGTQLTTPTVPPAPAASTVPTPATPNTFEEFALQLIAAESAIRKYCRDNATSNIREIYGTDHYTLEYTLLDSGPDDIVVRIKHRVIYVTVQKSGVKKFEDLRILPDIVDPKQAYWLYKDSKLEVHIDYNVQFSNPDAALRCNDVDSSTITVHNGYTLRDAAEVSRRRNQQAPQYYPNPPSYVVDNSGDQYTQQGIPTGSFEDVLSAIFSKPPNENIDIRNNSV